MVQVYLAIGSNVGNTRRNIKRSVTLLSERLEGVRRAPLYASKAVGYIDQPDFLNTAIGGQTDLSPQELLAFTKKVEQRIGRVERFRWGPREIDIDIIFYDNTVLRTPDLTLPHSAFRDRDFVLRPLIDLDPELTDPVSGLTVTELLDDLPAGNRAVLRRVDEKP